MDTENQEIETEFDGRTLKLAKPCSYVEVCIEYILVDETTVLIGEVSARGH